MVINAQDLAACHLLYEGALRDRPEEVGGDALSADAHFPVTGMHTEAFYL